MSKLLTAFTRRRLRRMPLIMDIGMHRGADSLFYLRKGFRVVAVEANPQLVDEARRNLATYLQSGQLTIEHVGIGANEGPSTFYVNQQNDQWSSFNEERGTRLGTPFTTLEIERIKPQRLFERYGMPYYLKIDIEGSDMDVVRALHDCEPRPRYISIEIARTSDFAELWAVRCRAFKLVDQEALSAVRCPRPAREGKYVDATFNFESTGPFGDEAPGKWMTFDEALEVYLTQIHSPTKGWLAQENSWFDVHGRVD